MKLILAPIVVALVLPAQAFAWTPDQAASKVAQTFAERTDVSVQCYGLDEPNSPDSFGAWGYTMPLVSPLEFMDGPTVCAGIDAIATDDPAVSDWSKALGALVLVHESYHLRPWEWRFDEARVECQAIRHWRYAARMLGATTAEADRLFPWALQAHWRLVRLAQPYYWAPCQVPGPS